MHKFNFNSKWNFVNRIIRKLNNLPSDTVFKINNNHWYARLVLLPRYQKQIDEHKKYLPTLNPHEQAIVEQIYKEGICITSLDSLAIPNTQQLLDAAQIIKNELFEQQLHSASSTEKSLFVANANQLIAHPEILRWGLSEQILRIVESYLGLPVGYGGLHLVNSVANGKEDAARKWHRDREDWKVIKVAIYLNDVDEYGGPFQCVKPEMNKLLINSVTKNKHLSNTEVQNILGNDADNYVTSCVGKFGTVIFADTASNYHRGKPPLKTDRSTIFYSYFSHRPKNPFLCERHALSTQQVIEFDAQLPLHMQGFFTWRQRYPGIGRFIPKNK